MKKIILTLLACVLLLGCVFTLVSCDKLLIGKYEADFVIYEATYEFGIGGKVILEIDRAFGEDRVYEGKYSFNESGDEITFEFADKEAEEFSITRSFVKGEEAGEKYIKLDGVKYTFDD